MYSYQVDAPAEEYEDEEEYEVKKQGQLSCWGNQQSMNLNPLILTNITGSPYFKVQLFNVKVSRQDRHQKFFQGEVNQMMNRGITMLNYEI